MPTLGFGIPTLTDIVLFFIFRIIPVLFGISLAAKFIFQRFGQTFKNDKKKLNILSGFLPPVLGFALFVLYNLYFMIIFGEDISSLIDFVPILPFVLGIGLVISIMLELVDVIVNLKTVTRIFVLITLVAIAITVYPKDKQATFIKKDKFYNKSGYYCDCLGMDREEYCYGIKYRCNLESDEILSCPKDQVCIDTTISSIR